MNSARGSLLRFGALAAGMKESIGGIRTFFTFNEAV
jgi:hypothetical protein